VRYTEQIQHTNLVIEIVQFVLCSNKVRSGPMGSDWVIMGSCGVISDTEPAGVRGRASLGKYWPPGAHPNNPLPVIHCHARAPTCSTFPIIPTLEESSYNLHYQKKFLYFLHYLVT